jgi:hypothetical protein
MQMGEKLRVTTGAATGARINFSCSARANAAPAATIRQTITAVPVARLDMSRDSTWPEAP